MKSTAQSPSRRNRRNPTHRLAARRSTMRVPSSGEATRRIVLGSVSPSRSVRMLSMAEPKRLPACFVTKASVCAEPPARRASPPPPFFSATIRGRSARPPRRFPPPRRMRHRDRPRRPPTPPPAHAPAQHTQILAPLSSCLSSFIQRPQAAPPSRPGQGAQSTLHLHLCLTPTRKKRAAKLSSPALRLPPCF